jgi:drug/metabolite transporter (DMT)-like permease
LAFVMMGSLIGRVGPTRASFITYLIPVVALVLGVALLGETVSLLAVIGSVLVIVGALLASRREGATATQGVPSTNMTGDEPT